MGNRNFNLPQPFTFQFVVTAAGTPEKLTLKRRSATIAFNENTPDADTITDSDNGFLIAGFEIGDMITVSGSASNDGIYHIATVTAGVITLEGKNDLTTEAAGDIIKIVAPKTIPDGISLSIKAKYANAGTICIADSSEKALNTTTGYFGLRNNEAIGIQVNNVDNVWIDATVSGEGVEVVFEKNIQS